MLFRSPHSLLPEVRSSSEIYGECHLLGATVPIAGIAGDQQAALFGQMCTQQGMVKNTYGTGCFMLMHTGKKAITSKNNLLTTIAWKIGKKTEYALEGSIFMGGAVVQWLRDGLGIIQSSDEVEALARSVPTSEGVIFVPALTGLGAPYWNAEATGMFTGLTRGTTKGHLARAVLEGIAYMNADILQAMQKDLGKPLTLLNVDGGASANNLLMQFQADILNLNLRRPKILETTSIGAKIGRAHV